MSEPDDAERGILRLPVELLQDILVCLPDPRSLVRTIQASPAFYSSFKQNEQHIIATVLTNCIGTGVLREAQLTRDCVPPVLSTELAEEPLDLDKELQDKLDTYIVDFLRSWPIASDLTRTSWALGDALALGDFHSEVILPLKDRFIQASSDPRSCAMAARIRKSLEVRPVSYLEQERICRALYRFEIFRRLFGCFSWRTDELMDFTTIFFSEFTPWEIAQLGCIHDFLGRQITPVFDDVARHDIVWGEFKTMFDANITDGAVQHLLTLGLEVILAIARLQDAPYMVREKTLSPEDKPPSENDDFFNSALIDFNYRACPANDEDLYNTLLSAPPFHPDNDLGPETIWRMSCPPDGSSLAVFERHDWISRCWGYVLWDHARLQNLDSRGDFLLSVLQEPATNPVPQPQNPSKEGREASWQRRSALYYRGCRGYWSEGEESKARWPKGEMTSRHGQLLKQEWEEKLRHKPESLEDAKRYWEAELSQHN